MRQKVAYIRPHFDCQWLPWHQISKSHHQHISVTVQSAHKNTLFVDTSASNLQAVFTFIRYKFTWERVGRHEHLHFTIHYSEIHCVLHLVWIFLTTISVAELSLNFSKMPDKKMCVFCVWQTGTEALWIKVLNDYTVLEFGAKSEVYCRQLTFSQKVIIAHLLAIFQFCCLTKTWASFSFQWTVSYIRCNKNWVPSL
jgi:hypothetical protein